MKFCLQLHSHGMKTKMKIGNQRFTAFLPLPFLDAGCSACSLPDASDMSAVELRRKPPCVKQKPIKF